MIATARHILEGGLAWLERVNTFFKARPRLQIGLGVALVALLLIAFRDELSLALFKVDPLFLVASALVSMALFPIAALRWYLIARWMCRDNPAIGSYIDYLKARMLTGVAGFIGAREVIEFGGRTVWMARKPGVTYAIAARVVLVDRVSDLYVSAACLFGALGYWLLNLSLSVTAGLVVGLPVVGIWLVYAVSTLARHLPRVGRAAILSDIAPLRNIIGPAFILSMLKFALLVLRVYFLMLATGAGLSLLHALATVPISQSIYLISITPGSLGFYELGWAALLKSLAVDSGAIVAFVILLRALVVLSAVWLLPFFPLLHRLTRTQEP